MYESHATALCDIEFAGERGGGHHGKNRHAVHVVANGFAVGDAEAAPPRALGGFEALKEVEEGNGGVGGFGVGGGQV